jgi:hypothetical protein
MANPLSGGPKLELAAVPLFRTSPAVLMLFPAVLLTETSEVFSETVWPPGRMASRNRRLSLPLPFNAEIAEVVAAGLTFPGSASVTSPSTRVPAGNATEPLLPRTESTTVTVKRSPALEVRVESGVSRTACISVLGATCTSTSATGAIGRAYVPEEDIELPFELYVPEFVLAGLAAPDDPVEGVVEVEPAGEVTAGVALVDGSELLAGAPLTRDAGGTGSVDAAGFVALAGEALLSCAGTCDCCGFTGEKVVPLWPIAIAPASRQNAIFPGKLRTLPPPLQTQKGEKQMNSRRLAVGIQLFGEIRHLSIDQQVAV